MRLERNLVRFPRLRAIRERDLGWDVIELVARLQSKPSVASIYRLERGEGIKPTHAKRVFDLVNQELNGALDSAQELVFIKSKQGPKQGK